MFCLILNTVMAFDWKDGEDNLYRACEDYRYSSTVQLDGGATPSTPITDSISS